MRSLFLALLGILFPAMVIAQTAGTAESVYRSSQESVFLVYVNDAGGSPTALGSAFLVGRRKLITNAHVVANGVPVLAVGPVRVPIKVVRTDRKNDLALLSVDVDLTSTPLTLATGDDQPGESVFAIGNPEGLEKTISQGIVSGLRVQDGRSLIQVTSPISHGSSGGPILNASGQVIGVAVGMLEDGQNLNFAVPVKYIKDLIAAGADAHEPVHTAAEAVAIEQRIQSEQYSDDDNSPYQRDAKELRAIMQSAIKSAHSREDLTALSCLGTVGANVSDDGINAARRLESEYPSTESKALLSYVLYKRAGTEEMSFLFSKDGSPEQTDAKARWDQYLNAAEQEASQTPKDVHGKLDLVSEYVLANVREDKSNYSSAIALFQPIAAAKPTICGENLAESSLRSLITDNEHVGNHEEAERSFRKLASQYTPTAYDWDSEGDRRRAANDYAAAADAYEHAGGASADYAIDYCYATANRFVEPVTDGDHVLSDGRACVDAATKNTNDKRAKDFKRLLSGAYSLMAQVLNDRGVYQPAMGYIKESLNGDPNNSSSLYLEAQIYENLGQPSECVAADQAAITQSDGKFGYMHFLLGNCYFDQQNWSNAASSFRISAEADKSDAASAFNLGLSLKRQGYTSDARNWFKEALARKPDSDLRSKILNALSN